jgi:hypothetical protein
MATPEAEAAIRKDLEGPDLQCIAIVNVQKQSRMSHTNLLCAITDRTLAVFDTRGVKKKLQESWIALRHISRSGNVLCLEWERSKFKCAFAGLGPLNSISEVLQRTLIASELERIGFGELGFPGLSPTPMGFVASVVERWYRVQADLPLILRKSIADVVVYGQHSVSLDIFARLEDFAPIFIRALPLLPTIMSLSIPARPEIDGCWLMAALAREKNTLKRIEINGPCSVHFDEFIQNLKENKSDELCSLSFVSSELNAAQVGLLGELTLKKGLVCLEFHDAISRAPTDVFCSDHLDTRWR